MRRRRACLKCDARFTTYERFSLGVEGEHATARRLLTEADDLTELRDAINRILERQLKAGRRVESALLRGEITS